MKLSQSTRERIVSRSGLSAPVSSAAPRIVNAAPPMMRTGIECARIVEPW